MPPSWNRWATALPDHPGECGVTKFCTLTERTHPVRVALSIRDTQPSPSSKKAASECLGGFGSEGQHQEVGEIKELALHSLVRSAVASYNRTHNSLHHPS
jgi:hypothetical protein